MGSGPPQSGGWASGGRVSGPPGDPRAEYPVVNTVMNTEAAHCAGHAGLDCRYTPAGIPIDVADSIIDQLIAVGFTLASCVDLADNNAVLRMGQAVAELDRAIHQLDTSRVHLDRTGAAGPGASQ